MECCNMTDEKSTQEQSPSHETKGVEPLRVFGVTWTEFWPQYRKDMRVYKFIFPQLAGTVVISSAALVAFRSVPYIEPIILGAVTVAAIVIPFIGLEHQRKISDDFRNAVQQNGSSPESVSTKQTPRHDRKQ